MLHPMFTKSYNVASRTLLLQTSNLKSSSPNAIRYSLKRDIFALGIKKQENHTKYSLLEALKQCKENAKCKFDETVDLAIQLGLDPRKPNQNIRGVTALPHGNGKIVRIAVFARGQKAEDAKDAGATIVGAEDLVEIVKSGKIQFDRCIATPDMMPLVGGVARILGPRGLMPNPKLGTLTVDVKNAVQAAKSGQLEFRVEKNGIIHAGVGKVSFSEKALLDNIRTLIFALSDAKPETSKGKYLKKAHLSSTMGRSFELDIKYIDPSSEWFMNFDMADTLNEQKQL